MDKVDHISSKPKTKGEPREVRMVTNNWARGLSNMLTVVMVIEVRKAAEMPVITTIRAVANLLLLVSFSRLNAPGTMTVLLPMKKTKMRMMMLTFSITKPKVLQSPENLPIYCLSSQFKMTRLLLLKSKLIKSKQLWRNKKRL